ncbi:MAG TPA: DUF488 domain-containing protein [Croceibacterium sp.]|nr:DUF488 domain-containing protein [Croceibacterium sp.]
MSGSDPLPICTIGHSTATIPEFVDLLRVGDVTAVVDIRTVPRSRHNPQYNLDLLPGELAAFQIRHEYIAELGGLRGKAPNVAPEVNGLWRNQSFHNYADYALTEDFRHALDRLLAVADRERCAIMCAEAVWWRCHRRIAADYLLVRGRAVFHLMWPTKIQPASLTPGAVPHEGSITYPAPG